MALLLLVIVLLLSFALIYFYNTEDNFENDFNNRATVLTEYIRRTGAEHQVPASLGYIDTVNTNLYSVTYFNTKNLLIEKISWHDDRIEIFDFIYQKFIPADNSAAFADRIQPTNEENKFKILIDDGWQSIDCPTNHIFNSITKMCEPIPVCYNKEPGLYALDEELLNRTILNNNNKATTTVFKYHPVLYLRCLFDGTHRIEECQDNHHFDGLTKECVLNNVCENKADGYILTLFPNDLLINQYLACEGGETKMFECPKGKIFDRRLLTCIDGDPCLLNGEGYTFITSDISDTQYYLCLSTTERNLITCINRVVVNNQYSCTGDTECLSFANGSGTQYPLVSNDLMSFETGRLVCDNYEIISQIQCDSADQIEGKLFNNLFTTDVHLPNEIFDRTTNTCVPFSIDNVTLHSKSYTINSFDNHYSIDFETAFAGIANKLPELKNTDDLNGIVSYSRDVGEIGLNPVTLEPIKCFGDVLYDIFAGTRLNLCEENELTNVIVMNGGQYFRPIQVQLAEDPDYTQECSRHIQNVENVVHFSDFRTQILKNIEYHDVCTEISTFLLKNIKYHERILFKPPKILFNTPKSLYNSEKKLYNIDENLSSMNNIKPFYNPFINETINDVEKSVDTGSKNITFQCFYSLPTFKFTECPLPITDGNESDDNDENASEISDGDRITTSLHNHQIDPECQNAEGLINVINSYAYLGNNIGCRSVLTTDGINVVKEENPLRFLNIEYQSNDNFKYNQFIHYHNNKFTACPPELFIDGRCNKINDVLWYLEDLQI